MLLREIKDVTGDLSKFKEKKKKKNLSIGHQIVFLSLLGLQAHFRVPEQGIF